MQDLDFAPRHTLGGRSELTTGGSSRVKGGARPGVSAKQRVGGQVKTDPSRFFGGQGVGRNLPLEVLGRSKAAQDLKLL